METPVSFLEDYNDVSHELNLEPWKMSIDKISKSNLDYRFVCCFSQVIFLRRSQKYFPGNSCVISELSCDIYVLLRILGL
jgi:hypothetical protein